MITKQDVKYVADLSRIKLNEDELTRLSKQLVDILNYINKLNQLDVSRIEPMSHVLHLKNVFREDKLKPSLPIQEVINISKFKENNFFKVPIVIEE